MIEREIKRIKRIRPQDHLILHDEAVPFLTFPVLDAFPWLTHGFATRYGGITEGPRGSMDLSMHALWDGHEDVAENYSRIGNAIGFNCDRTVGAFQVHGTKVRKVTMADAGNIRSRDKVFTEEDGFVTDTPGLCLCVYFADCVPLFAADPIRRAIGSAHSGWRGTAGRIGTRLVEKMHEEFGSDPKDLICCIGPSICQDCYEVSEDVAKAFRAAYSPEQIRRMLTAKGGGKYQLDLHQAALENFLEAGVTYDHISVTDICTCCEKDLIFSHRGARGGKHGLSAGFIMIR